MVVIIAHLLVHATDWIIGLFRPLVLGSRVRNGKKEYCVASEDCAFGPIGFQRVRDVAPGEMLIVTGVQMLYGGILPAVLAVSGSPTQCMTVLMGRMLLTCLALYPQP